MTLSDEQAASLQAELGQLTGLSLGDFFDLESCGPEDRAMLLDGWRELGKLSWSQEKTTFDRVVDILSALAAIAAPVTVVTGGVSGFAGAISAIRGM